MPICQECDIGVDFFDAQRKAHPPQTRGKVSYQHVIVYGIFDRDVYVWGFCHDDTYWASF